MLPVWKLFTSTIFWRQLDRCSQHQHGCHFYDNYTDITSSVLVAGVKVVFTSGVELLSWVCDCFLASDRCKHCFFLTSEASHSHSFSAGQCWSEHVKTTLYIPCMWWVRPSVIENVKIHHSANIFSRINYFHNPVWCSRLVFNVMRCWCWTLTLD